MPENTFSCHEDTSFFFVFSLFESEGLPSSFIQASRIGLFILFSSSALDMKKKIVLHFVVQRLTLLNST